MNIYKMLTMLTAYVCISAASLYSETHVYLCNRTDKNLGLSYSQQGQALPMDAWKSGADNIAAGAEQMILSLNRNFGITDGQIFIFDTSVSMPDLAEQIVLSQKLEGTTLGSNLWEAASGPGFSDPWTNDREVHSQFFKVGDNTYKLSYYSQVGGIHDDLYYIVEPFIASGTSTEEVNA